MPICQKCPKTCHKQTLLFYARGLPSNTSMPGPTALTVPNHSSITLSASTQRCNKLPIGYNGTRQIDPKNCSFLFDDNHQNLIHPYLFRPHSPPQTASASNQPFCHNTYDICRKFIPQTAPSPSTINTEIEYTHTEPDPTHHPKLCNWKKLQQ